jgi:phosphatidylserine synthase
VIAACRLVVGATALILALEGNSLYLISTLITLGVVVRGFTELATARIEAPHAFGTSFEGFADYLAVVVGPWALTRALLIGPRTIWQEGLLDLPLMAGAVRLARNQTLAARDRERPGIDAAFVAFVGVSTVFLRIPELLSSEQLTAFLTPTIAFLSAMMVVPLRYPRLTHFGAWSAAGLLCVAAMPFVYTERLTAAVVVFGVLYCVFGHLVPTHVTD